MKEQLAISVQVQNVRAVQKKHLMVERIKY